MKKIFTVYKQHHICATFDQDELTNLQVFEESSDLGTIYVGQVKNIVANINAAFIGIQKEEPIYLPLDQENEPIFLNEKKNKQIQVGDTLLIQINKEAMKSKLPGCTCKLSLKGHHLVCVYQHSNVGISKKISDPTIRDNIKDWLTPYCLLNIGFVVRTSAANATKDELCKEAKSLQTQLLHLLEISKTRSIGSKLYQEQSEYIEEVAHLTNTTDLKIITDIPDVYEELHHYFEHNDSSLLPVLELYTYDLPLSAMYNLEKNLSIALSKKVWLNSGGYLIIEPTEALTVVDVNTGKAIQKKKKESHILDLNLEAAKEICRQLVLRNLSGIIIVDFINMQSVESQEKLMTFLAHQLAFDPVKTTLIDITKLGLVELTRKKIKKPLHEQWTKEENVL